MKFGSKLFALLIPLALILAACGTKPATEARTNPTDSMMETAMPNHDNMTGEPQSTPDATMESNSSSTSGTPDWFSASLTNVHTGDTFTVNNLKGKVVLVETMAVWCTNCFQQQTQVKALHASLGQRDDLVSMGMDIDPNEDAPKLKSFTEKNGFDWIYVISPANVSRDLAALYGNQFLNPPSTPMLIIDRHGEVHPLPFGIKSADDLMTALQPYLDEAM